MCLIVCSRKVGTDRREISIEQEHSLSLYYHLSLRFDVQIKSVGGISIFGSRLFTLSSIFTKNSRPCGQSQRKFRNRDFTWSYLWKRTDFVDWNSRTVSAKSNPSDVHLTIPKTRHAPRSKFPLRDPRVAHRCCSPIFAHSPSDRISLKSDEINESFTFYLSFGITQNHSEPPSAKHSHLS
jgi:hypothetical protein